MTTSTIKISGMSCQHCVKAVSGALLDLPGVQKADVSLEEAKATVTYDEALADEAGMRAAILEQGYEVVR